MLYDYNPPFSRLHAYIYDIDDTWNFSTTFEPHGNHIWNRHAWGHYTWGKIISYIWYTCQFSSLISLVLLSPPYIIRQGSV